MTQDTRQINLKVTGQADLRGASQEVDKFRQRIEQLEKQVKGMGAALKDVAAAGAYKGLTQGLDYTRQLTTSSISGGAMYGRISGGLSQYKAHVIEIDNEARAVKRLGEAYRDFHRSLTDAGRAYGFSNNEVIGLASMLSRTNGRAGAGQLTSDMRTVQGFARSYGMGALEYGSLANQASRQGIVGRGGDVAGMREFSAMMADAISKGGMQGREQEVITSILSLTRSINSQTVRVGGTNVAAAALTTLNATGIRGLQGEQGAGLLDRLNSAIQNPGGGEAGNLFMYQALSGGRGGMSLADFSYLKEEGLGGQGPTGKSNLQAVMERVNGMGISGRYRLMAASNLTGLSMHQYEALEKAFFKNGKFDMAKMGGLQGALGPEGLQQVDPSVWGLLADLQNGADVGDVGREFSQLTGQQAATTKGELFNQIKGYGESNVALSQGQQREKLDNDIAKASEDAASKLYDLQTAADQLAKKMIEMGGALPGPLGGVAPIMLGSLGGNLLTGGGRYLGGKGGDLFSRLFKGAPGGGGGGALAEAAETATESAAGGQAAGWLSRAAPFAAAAGQFAGGLGMGTAAAWAGSEIAQRAYGTQGFLSEGHQQAIGQGWNNITSGNVNLGDVGNAVGGMIASPLGVLGGTLYGGYRALTGQEGFQSAYRSGFFNIDRFDSEGRRQWQAQGQGGNGGGGGSWASSDPFKDAVNSMVAGGNVISGWGDPRDGGKRHHEGIDIASPEGSDIRALAGGKVTFSGVNQLGGNVVQIQDANGRNYYYAHMKGPSSYKVGDVVDAGAVLGQIGTSGDAKGTTPHLHFQISDTNGQWVDPQAVLGGGADQKTVEKVDQILKGTGMEGKGALLLALSRRYSVPVELALAQFAKEAQFNTTGVAPRNNNPGNLRYTGNWGDDRQGEGGFAHFPNLDAGIEGYFKLMGGVYGAEIAEGVQSGNWSRLVNKYAPPSDGNNSKQYAEQMASWIGMYSQKINSSRGGWWNVPGDEMPTLLHRREMVLPQYLADPLRDMVEKPGLNGQEALHGAAAIRITIDPIILRLPDGSTQSATARGQYTAFDGVIAHPIGSSQ